MAKMSKKEKRDLLEWQIKLLKEVMKISPNRDYELVLKQYQAELKILRRKS